MDDHDTRWALADLGDMLGIMVEVEGMKAANCQYPEDQPYGLKAFQDQAVRLFSKAKDLRGE